MTGLSLCLFLFDYERKIVFLFYSGAPSAQLCCFSVYYYARQLTNGEFSSATNGIISGLLASLLGVTTTRAHAAVYDCDGRPDHLRLCVYILLLGCI